MPNPDKHRPVMPPPAVMPRFPCLRTSIPSSAGHARLELVGEVNRLIDELLVEGATAARLGMPARRLRERLAQAGVRFNELLSDCRCNLAKRLLVDTEERIERIAERTGFSEPSTFCRAFKRWVGQTPVEFRRRGRTAAS
ncbi:helix-turn-helix transcriptional regulator [Pseudomonas sp. D2-3]